MDLMEKNKSGITRADIQTVANELTIGMTDEQLTQVWEEYDEVVGDYPNDNWKFIVEEIIWGL